MNADDDLTRDAQSRLGTLLRGKYRLERILGTGGMAVVYAATHRNGKRVAVKMLHRLLSQHADIRSRFLREGRAANAVEHPGAVEVDDDDVAEDGSAFLVMELLDGMSVEARWIEEGRRLPASTVLEIADQLLAVLAAAHRVGIVHRDIKPANVFLTKDGVVKVLDFGIARIREAASTTQAGTQTGMMYGTPAFMAPEHAFGRSADVDAQSDLWAVGATMFTLLSGKLVHEGATTPQELMILAATRRARSLATELPDAPPELVAVVDRALAYEKPQRWPSADAMRAAIVGLLNRPSVASFAPPRLSVASTILGEKIDAPKTFEPISRSRPLVAVRTNAGSKRMRAIGAACVGLLAAGLVARGVIRNGEAPKVAAATPASPSATAPPPPAEASTAPPEPTRASAATEEKRSIEAALVPVASGAGAAGGTRKPTIGVRHDAHDAGAPLIAPPTASAVAPAPQPKAPDCTFPFTIDKNGTRHPREECP